MAHFQYRIGIQIWLFIALWYFAAHCQPNDKPDTFTRPSDKEIIRIVFTLDSVSLASHFSCNNVGPDTANSNIGDFISDIWKFHTDTTGKNFIKIECKEIEGKEARNILAGMGFNCSKKKNEKINSWCNEPLWSVEFHICRQNYKENEEWCWGIMFLLKQKDKSLIPGSVRCSVAG